MVTKLKLGPLVEQKPVKVTIELPANLYGDLASYAQLLSQQQGQEIDDPSRLIVPMLQRFIATDRGFLSMRKQVGSG